MDVLGPKGVIRFPGMFDPKELPEGFDQQKYGAYLVDTGAKKRIVKFRKNNMFAEEWRDFVSAVTRNRTPKVTGEIAKLALAVGLAALKAGSSRKPVKIHV